MHLGNLLEQQRRRNGSFVGVARRQNQNLISLGLRQAAESDSRAPRLGRRGPSSWASSMKKAGVPSSPSKASARRGFFSHRLAAGVVHAGRVLRRQRCVRWLSRRDLGDDRRARRPHHAHAHGGAARAALAVNDPDVAEEHLASGSGTTSRTGHRRGREPPPRAHHERAGGPRARARGRGARGARTPCPAVFLYSCVGTDQARRRLGCTTRVRHYLDLGVPTERFLLVLHAPSRPRPPPRPARRAGGGNATRARSRAPPAPPTAALGGRARADGRQFSRPHGSARSRRRTGRVSVAPSSVSALAATACLDAARTSWIAARADSDAFHALLGRPPRGSSAEIDAVAASAPAWQRAMAPPRLAAA